MARSARPTPQRIADAAYELFYKEGFAHVSVDAIAAAADRENPSDPVAMTKVTIHEE